MLTSLFIAFSKKQTKTKQKKKTTGGEWAGIAI